MKSSVIIGAVALCCAASVRAFDIDEGALFPFLTGKALPEGAADMRPLLDAPAGKYGFVRSEGEHFVTSHGILRLNAVNLTAPANFPDHDKAERLAERFARLGINCVRYHYFDEDYKGATGKGGHGIVLQSWRGRRDLDPAQLDKIHYLTAELKKRGIYVDVNLHVGRTLDERDGFAKMPWAARGVNTLCVPAIVAMEQDYARKLLTAKNPYTGLSFAEDPAVAIVEIANENGLFSTYYGEKILDKLGEPYKTFYKVRWNVWLEKQYGTAEAVSKAWGVKTAALGEIPVIPRDGGTCKEPQAATNDFCRFLAWTDREFWVGMRDYLKNELKVKCAVVGTQLDYTPPHTQALLDAVDKHTYWHHPNGKWEFDNESILDAPYPGGSIQVGESRVKGRPYLVTESNNPFPSVHGAEYQPLLHAYGAFQDWAGIFLYTWNCLTDPEPESIDYYFSYCARADCVVHLPACSAMFLRGDVARYRERIDVALTYDEFLMKRASNKAGSRQGIASATDGKASRETVLVHGVAVDVNATSPEPANRTYPKMPLCKGADGARDFASDTGELLWHTTTNGTSYATVKTKNVKFFSGMAAGKTIDLGDGVQVTPGESMLGWEAISLLSRNATGFGADGQSAQILLAATGYGGNTGLKMNYLKKDNRTFKVPNDGWGKPPYLVEGISAVVRFDVPATRVKAWALDADGKRVKSVHLKTDGKGRAVLVTGPEYRTIWYEVMISR